MSNLQEFSDALTGTVATVAPGLFSVHSRKSRSTGFLWRPGLVVTSDEALAEEGDVAVVASDGNERPATVVGRDAATAIAVLRFEADGVPAVSLTPALPKVGALVMAVGAEHGAPTAALGIVAAASGPWRSMRGGAIDARIALDVRPRRTAQGGLAVDAAGHVFGMIVSGPRRRVLVIPTATIERIAPRLETHGRIPRGYLGLGLQSVAVDGGGHGAMVVSVDATGPGAAAGVRQGDIVVAWNGQGVEGVQALIRSLGPDSVGETVALDLRRAGQPVRIDVRIGERPAA